MGDMRKETLPALAALVGRLLVASLFLLEAMSKIRGYDLAVAYMERFSVPSALLPLAILVELGGALLLAIGWQARLAALALAIFSILTAVLFHANLADRNQVLHLQKDLAIAGGLLVLFAFGPGPYAIEARRRPTDSRPVTPGMGRGPPQTTGPSCTPSACRCQRSFPASLALSRPAQEGLPAPDLPPALLCSVRGQAWDLLHARDPRCTSSGRRERASRSWFRSETSFRHSP